MNNFIISLEKKNFFGYYLINKINLNVGKSLIQWHEWNGIL